GTTDGGTDGTDGTDGTTDGGTDGTDGTTDGGTDGTDGTTDGGTDGTDGTTDGGTDGTTDGGTDGTTPTITPIADVQSGAAGLIAGNGSDTFGDTVTVRGVVAHSALESGFYLLDGNGGEYSGVWVYTPNRAATTGDTFDLLGLVEGTQIELMATVEEYAASSDASGQTLTELFVTSPSTMLVTGDWGISMPTPDLVTTADLAVGAEAWEGVLITIEDATVVAGPNEFGEFEITDGLLVDDQLYAWPDVLDVTGTFTSITGVLTYTFGAWKLEPRTAADFGAYSGPPCPADLCMGDVLAGDLIVSEFQNDVGDSEDHCEWVEIFNNTGSSIDLNGLVLDDGEGTGTISGSVIAPAGALFVLGKASAADWATLCPTTAAYVTPLGYYGGDPDLSNSGDNLDLYLPDGVTLIDGTPGPLDASSTQSNSFSGDLLVLGVDNTVNDGVSNWCDVTPSPGVSNPDCTP
ncbi:MAG: hypothetical protein RL071_4051, partial [Pseudomonadota bacterium]